MKEISLKFARAFCKEETAINCNVIMQTSIMNCIPSRSETKFTTGIYTRISVYVHASIRQTSTTLRNNILLSDGCNGKITVAIGGLGRGDPTVAAPMLGGRAYRNPQT